MPSVLDQIQQRDTRDENQRLQQAASDNQWANFFTSTPPTEQLRANRNYEQAINTAIARKQELLAQTDAKEVERQHAVAQFEEFKRLAPLREEKLKRQVASEGAHEEFVQRKDADTMADVSGFMSEVGKIKSKVGTDEYKMELSNTLQRFPRILSTQAGAETLRNLYREVEDVSAMTPPAGMMVDTITQDENGKAKATFKPIPVKAEHPAIPANLVPSSFTVNDKGGVTQTFREPSADKSVLPSLERERSLHAKSLDRAKRIRSKATDAAIIADADADIVESEKALADVESQIRTQRDGGTKAAATAQGERLDTDRAKALLAEAGGDKAKARQLAKERGFQF